MSLVVIAHNLRSTHNVGSIFRTCDGFGVDRLYLTGYTPYPTQPGDQRLPHEAEKLSRQIHKTALGAETSLPFEHRPSVEALLDQLRADGYRLVGLEQDPRSQPLASYRPSARLALLLGEEVAGIAPELRQRLDDLVEITMHGRKESFNVSVAAGIALYGLCLADQPAYDRD